MSGFDIVVLTVIGLSIVLAAVRGAVREAFHLGGWIVAFLVSSAYAGALSLALPAVIEHPGLRLAIAFVLLFISTLILAALFGLMVSKAARSAGLGLADRTLGAIFGLARGLLIVIVVVMVAGLTSLPKERFWREARLSDPLEAMALRLRPWLPEDLSRKLRYD